MAKYSSSSINYEFDADDFFNKLINYNGNEDTLAEEQSENSTPEPLNSSSTHRSPIRISDCGQTAIFSVNNERLKRVMLDHDNCNSDLKNYTLDIVEQPRQCRISAYGDKDRRPIDPAPIIRLRVEESDGNNIEDNVEFPFYLLHASLWSADKITRYDLVQEHSGSRPLRLLIGSVMSSPALLKDLEDKKGYFFAFPDLSIRMTGEYRLQFSLIHLARNAVIEEVFSDPFTVYPTKTYPGMRESSLLSRHLAKQGLKLTIRSQVRLKTKNKNSDS